MNASVNTDQREVGEEIHSCESQKSAMKKGANKLATIARQDRRRIHATADTRKWSAGDRNKKRATRKKSNSGDTVTEECRKAASPRKEEREKLGAVRDTECQCT
ncbi:hypothetical protein HN011_005017 [Eciton burchellii]|nr:hypothetical protein HN011_005017 [Eciton burchellii]